MPRRKAVTLTRPELPARGYDFSKHADEGCPPASEKKEKKAGDGMNPQGPPLRGGPQGGSPPQAAEEKNKTKDGLLAQLLALAPADRRDILARLALSEKESKTGKGRELEMWTGAVYPALVDAVGADGEVGAGPLALKRLLGDSSAWGPVSNFLRSSRILTLPVPKQQSVLNLLGRLLVDHAREAARRSGAPLTPRFVASCAPNVYGVFDNAFPGYIRNLPLVAMVAERLTQRREEGAD